MSPRSQRPHASARDKLPADPQIPETGPCPNPARELVGLTPDLLGLILENSPVGITLLTPDLRYLLVSRQASEFMGLPRKDIIGRHCYDVLERRGSNPGSEGSSPPCEDCPAVSAMARGEPVTQVRHARNRMVAYLRHVPLVVGDSTIGVLEIIENIAAKVIDPLTAMYNYRYYEEIMEQESYRALRYGGNLSLLALDIDNFKSVNDRYGHVEGDKVLQAVAQTIAEGGLRKTDHLCRVGGDEFAIIAPHTNASEAARLADRTRAAVREAFSSFGIDLSVGVASFPGDTDNPEQLRKIADSRLYGMKDARAPASGPGA
jgi:diguanylate cyclase (GGDEF)-like protein